MLRDVRTASSTGRAADTQSLLRRQIWTGSAILPRSVPSALQSPLSAPSCRSSGPLWAGTGHSLITLSTTAPPPQSPLSPPLPQPTARPQQFSQKIWRRADDHTLPFASHRLRRRLEHRFRLVLLADRQPDRQSERADDL